MTRSGQLIETVHDSEWSGSLRLRCPHCDRSLPIDARGECDRCGAHLQVRVVTTAPPIDGGGE